MKNYLTESQKNCEKMLSLLGLQAEVSASERKNGVRLLIASDDPGRIIGRNGRTLRAIQYLLNAVLNRPGDDGPRLTIDIDGYREKRPRRRGADTADGGDGGGSEPAPRAERRPRGERRPRRDDRGPRRGGGRPRRESRDERVAAGPSPEASNGGIDRARLQRQAEDAVKEVKRWGEPVRLPPMAADAREIVEEVLNGYGEIRTVVRGEGDRARLELNLRADGQAG